MKKEQLFFCIVFTIFNLETAQEQKTIATPLGAFFFVGGVSAAVAMYKEAFNYLRLAQHLERQREFTAQSECFDEEKINLKKRKSIINSLVKDDLERLQDEGKMEALDKEKKDLNELDQKYLIKAKELQKQQDAITSFKPLTYKQTFLHEIIISSYVMFLMASVFYINIIS